MKYPAKRSRVVKPYEQHQFLGHYRDQQGRSVAMFGERTCTECGEAIRTRRVKELDGELVHASCANEGAK